MEKCPHCSFTRFWQMSDGQRKCRRCGTRYWVTSAWDASRLSDRVKHELVQRFVWGVPVYRQRFGTTASRSAGTAISYNVGVLLFGGLVPLITSTLFELTSSKMVSAYYIIFGTVLSLLLVWMPTLVEHNGTRPHPHAAE